MLAAGHPEHLVLHITTLRAVGVDRQPYVEPLDRMGFDAGEVEGVGHGRIQAGLAAAPGVVVLADEHRVLQKRLDRPGWRMRLEEDVREEIALVEAVEVDLELAADVRLVVRRVIEVDRVDLDGAVVAGRIGTRSARRVVLWVLGFPDVRESPRVGVHPHRQRNRLWRHAHSRMAPFSLRSLPCPSIEGS